MITSIFESVSDVAVCLGYPWVLRLSPVSSRNGGQFALHLNHIIPNLFSAIPTSACGF
jgi:hypothetical protein